RASSLWQECVSWRSCATTWFRWLFSRWDWLSMTRNLELSFSCASRSTISCSSFSRSRTSRWCAALTDSMSRTAISIFSRRRVSLLYKAFRVLLPRD
ncbi:hypothetical protein KEM55_004501, partial [Ascosphaera atra]